MAKTETEITHDYTCDINGCDKPAIINIGDAWHEYQITPNGNFKELKTWSGDNNEFYCEEHGEEYA